ncbi:MAG: hypothetical protein H8E27_13440 [Verrucomicrobia subdivision 3 bacterium]|nr:hypothetical protein [Limisphaerales bacterium]
MTTPSNPLPSHIVVHGNCVDCGRPVEFSPAPFTGKASKPLAPGNTRLHMEMPDEVQHKSPERCKKCKLAHYTKWQARRKQLPWLIGLVTGLLALAGWILLK